MHFEYISVYVGFYKSIYIEIRYIYGGNMLNIGPSVCRHKISVNINIETALYLKGCHPYKMSNHC